MFEVHFTLLIPIYDRVWVDISICLQLALFNFRLNVLQELKIQHLNVTFLTNENPEWTPSNDLFIVDINKNKTKSIEQTFN